MNVRLATRADLDALVPLHREAFVGTIGERIGDGYARAFLAWFVEARDAVALVAEDAGAVVGYVVGAVDGYGPRLTRDVLPAIVLGALRHAPAVVRHPSFRRQVRARLTHLLLRREPAHAVQRATSPGAMCLVAIGTATHARGRGVGRALIEAFCAHERTRAAPAVILDVFRTNGAARALYEKSGFAVLAEAGDVVRMERRVAA